MKDLKKRKVLSGALIFAMIFQLGIDLPNINAETVGNLTVTGGTKDTDYSYADNVLTVKTNTPLTISGTTTADTIMVGSTATAAKITLNGANVDVSGTANKAAIETKSGSNATITLEGSNTLKSGSTKAGFAVDAGSAVTIQGEGSVEATGGAQAAGIGANKDGNTGTINITSGTVKAIATAATTASEPNGAGIGGAANTGKKSTGIVNISGGIVEATGAKRGAGIGEGGSNTSTDSDTSTFSTTISGGTVIATGGDSGAGIGAGYQSGKVTTTITGGTITATGGNHSAGIGGGNAANTVTTNITGGMVTAAAGQNNGAGIGGGYGGDGITTVISGGVVIANGSTNGGPGIGLGKTTGGSSDTRMNSFTTTNTGNAFILASSIQDVSKKAEWKGLIFDGNTGAIYGKTYTLAANVTIPENHTLAIAEGDTLTIPTGITLTNSGTINNAGKIIKNGTLAGTPATGDGAQTADSSVAVTFSKNEISYGENAIITATISPEIADANKGTVKFYLGDAASGKLLNAEPIAVTDQTATLEMSGAVWQTEGANWAVGENTITAVYSGTTGLETSSGTGTFTFKKVDNNPIVTMDDFMFGTTPSTPVVNGNLTGNTPTYMYKVKDASDDTYTADVPTNAGAYTVQASIAADGNHNAVKVTADFNITKAITATPTGLTATNESIFGKEDGKIVGLTKTLMEYSSAKDTGYTVVTNADMTFAPGTYYVRAAATDANHEPSLPVTVIIEAGAKVKVETPETQTGYSVAVDKTELGWKDSAVLTFTLAPGYTKTDNFAVKLNGSPVTLVPGTDGVETYTIPMNQSAAKITVEGIADTTAPTGTIKMGTNSWKTALNTITFGLFFNENQNVRIAGTDEGSGVAKIEYHVASDKVDSPENLPADEWTEGTTFAIVPNEKAVIYARITDKAGNVTIINSDGIVVYTNSTIDPQEKRVDYDNLSDLPITMTLNDNTLKEIKQGTKVLTPETDYTVNNNVVTLKKAYLEKLSKTEKAVLTFVFNPMGVTSTEDIATATLTISGKIAITPTVKLENWEFGATANQPVVTGNTGNGKETFMYKTKDGTDFSEKVPTAIGEYTVKVDIAQTGDYAHGTATADFAITKVSQAAPTVTAIDETIAGKGDGKISGLTTAMEYATTKDGVYKDITDVNMPFTPGTYYVRMKEDATHAASATTMIEVKAGRKLKVTTPEKQVGYRVLVDKTELNWMDDVTITYLLQDGYQQTADFAVMVNGKVVPLTNGRYVLSKNEQDVTITVKGVVKVYTYGILEGTDSEWTPAMNTGLTFRIDGDFTKFKGIQIDGKAVDTKNYEAKAGSTIITLKSEYLKTLATGKHKIDVVFTNKTVSVDFMTKADTSVKPEKDNKKPQTGDYTNMSGMLALLVVSAGAIIFITKRRFIHKQK